MRPPAYLPPPNPFGWVIPADGAGPVSPEAAPQPTAMSFGDVLSALNPLQHVPVVGRIYRAATGDDIPAPLKILGAGIFGGPLGIIGAAIGELAIEIIARGPDTSRPAAPAGMSATGSEASVQPVTPGTLGKDAYLTLATTQPDWLRPSTPEQLAMIGEPQRALDAYKAAASAGMMFAQGAYGTG
jgi:hypothetical protein